MKYAVFSTSPLTQKTDCLVLGLFKEDTDNALFKSADEKTNGKLSRLIQSGDISTDSAKSTWVLGIDGPFERILCIGLGKKDEYSLENLRKSARAVAAALVGSPVTKAVSAIPAPATLSYASAALETVVQAISAATYRSDGLKSKPKDAAKLAELRIHAPELPKKNAAALLKQAEAIAAGMNLTKDLGNLPGNVCTPKYLAKQAKKLAKANAALSVEILGEKEMRKLGMGSFLSVSAGSEEEGQLIVIRYNGSAAETRPHVLVGKGITFDTGGISLKPGEAMDEMKYDMCGAASVFGTLKALAEMQAPLHVIGVIAAAENMPSGQATKPGDIVTSLSGQTIEILNTDAEGRLVLCDALTYAERFEPETIVDIATLTGACIIALGHQASGLLANNDELASQLLAAGQQTGDRCWQLPLWDEYNTQLDSNFADMQNIGGRPAGTITAACFLSRFTKKMKWAHLDIAGTAWVSGKDKGATGRPVPLLTRYLLNQIPSA